jgi:aryl-alcohol dehydrogenase
VPRLLPGRTIRGVTLGDSEPETFLPFLVEAYRRGALPLDRIERRYRFEDINDAARDAASGVTIKPVLLF